MSHVHVCCTVKCYTIHGGLGGSVAVLPRRQHGPLVMQPVKEAAVGEDDARCLPAPHVHRVRACADRLPHGLVVTRVAAVGVLLIPPPVDRVEALTRLHLHSRNVATAVTAFAAASAITAAARRAGAGAACLVRGRVRVGVRDGVRARDRVRIRVRVRVRG